MNDLVEINTTKPFRLRNKCIHLTYTHVHLDLDATRAHFGGMFGGLKYYSMCHETGKEGTHDHTHVFLEWNDKPDIKSARFFDINGTHPNVKKVNTNLHKKRIWKYHEKENSTRICSTAKPFTDGDLVTRIREAESLAEAIEEASVEIKTVADLIHIRNDKRKRKQYQHSHPDAEWTIPELNDYERRCVFVHGTTGCGKTQWALHQFDNPLLVRHLDKLAEFDGNYHDGIVFDDMSFAHLFREAIIYLTDWEEESDIHVRYRTATIPKYTRKIFTSNKTFQENFPPDEHGAIRRRFTKIISVRGRVFKRRDPQPVLGLVPGEPQGLLEIDAGSIQETGDQEMVCTQDGTSEDALVVGELWCPPAPPEYIPPPTIPVAFGPQSYHLGLSPPNASYHEYMPEDSLDWLDDVENILGFN